MCTGTMYEATFASHLGTRASTSVALGNVAGGIVGAAASAPTSVVAAASAHPTDRAALACIVKPATFPAVSPGRYWELESPPIT